MTNFRVKLGPLDPTLMCIPRCDNFFHGKKLFSERELLKIVDVLGKETTLNKNTILLYIYKNGKVEKLIITK